MSDLGGYSYRIETRPDHLGSGWRLRLIDPDGEEAGGGVFDDYADAVAEAEDWLASR